MKSVLQPLAKSALIPLGLKAAASATDKRIYKNILGSGTTTIIISNKEMKNMKIVKSLEDSGFLIKGVAQTIENQTKKQKGGFFGILLCTLGASLLGNMLASKGVIR